MDSLVYRKRGAEDQREVARAGGENQGNLSVSVKVCDSESYDGERDKDRQTGRERERERERVIGGLEWAGTIPVD